MRDGIEVVVLGMTRAALIIIAAAALVVLAVSDARLDGTLVVSSDFRRATPYFSVLGPPTRVGPAGGLQRFFAEPVYFDLRLPRWFSRATVEAAWSKDIRLDDPKLGAALDPSDDRIEGKFALYPLARVEKRGDVIISRAEIDLASLPRSRYGYRLFFSVPGVDKDTPFFISDVSVRAERGSLAGELRRVLRGYLKI